MKDIFPEKHSSSPDGVSFDGSLLFAADDGVYGRELWRSDGTADGAVLLKSIGRDDLSLGSSSPGNFVTLGNAILLTANTPEPALWKTDGTSLGTLAIAPLSPRSLTVIDTRVFFFVAAEGDDGRAELWRSDGTTDGRALARLRAEHHVSTLLVTRITRLVCPYR